VAKPSLHTAGSWAYDSSGSITVTLPTHSAGDMLLVRVAIKSGAIATCVASCATAGWAKVGQFAGSTNSGNGTGSVLVAVFWKEAASGSETNPTIDFSQTNTQGGVVGMSYTKGAGDTAWVTPVGDGGLDEGTANTSHSATIQTHVSATANDLIDFFTGIRDDTVMTVPTFTQAGLTLDAVVEAPAAAGTDTGGADGAYDGGYRTVASGTSSAAAVVTGTLSTSEQGTSWTTRLRSFAPEEHSGTLAATGGGVAVEVGQKNGLSAQAFTGGGIIVAVSTTNRQIAATETGGGVLAASATTDRPAPLAVTGGGVLADAETTDRQAAMTATGGGVSIFDYEVSGSENHDGTLVATAGGAGVFSQSTDRPTLIVATAGGVVVIAGEAGFLTVLAATGGGVAAVEATTNREMTAEATGGGTAVLAAIGGREVVLAATGAGAVVVSMETARAGQLAGTGGGVATLIGTQAESHDGALSASGAGVSAFAAITARMYALAATGGGTGSATASTERLGSLSATGGGIVQVVGGSGIIPVTSITPRRISGAVSGGSLGGSIGSGIAGVIVRSEVGAQIDRLM
jgi:hypothetical protein